MQISKLIEKDWRQPIHYKEHLFTLSDNNNEDYNFVHHVQNLILTYLREQHLTVDKIHEFTDAVLCWCCTR